MNNNYYEIQVKFNKKDWITVHKENRHGDAVVYLRDNTTEDNKYPMRIVRVNRTIVFNGER